MLSYLGLDYAPILFVYCYNAEENLLFEIVDHLLSSLNFYENCSGPLHFSLTSKAQSTVKKQKKHI